ncbi:MAG: type II toxin-antitoxin system RelE/ParE family toxin [Bacteroidales bacterium]|nr:type II toxin-antitoxin system RelE/ParE family toxin [Candidatus Cacconaster equi]
MRMLRRTNEFDEFYGSVEPKVQEKIDYALSLIAQIKVVSTKFVKKLEGTDFYEMRVSIGNEYRVIIFTIDCDSFIESNEVLLLNGFMKKSTKDYKAQIRFAEKIIKELAE